MKKLAVFLLLVLMINGLFGNTFLEKNNNIGCPAGKEPCGDVGGVCCEPGNCCSALIIFYCCKRD